MLNLCVCCVCIMILFDEFYNKGLMLFGKTSETGIVNYVEYMLYVTNSLVLFIFFKQNQIYDK